MSGPVGSRVEVGGEVFETRAELIITCRTCLSGVVRDRGVTGIIP